ncbi:MAG: hypothetical protein JKY96_08365 [Phycisphaerales bacterium]|nr:hypothetical protein [Phycisphaerales bacterium]
MWDPSAILSSARESLMRTDSQLGAQQAVRGLDSLKEISLHPIVEHGLTDLGLGVHREIPYPSANEFVPKNSARKRCDLVVTPKPDMEIFDPIGEQKLIEMAAGTLFSEVAHELSPQRVGVDPSDCYWIEIKSIAQFAYVDGVPGANSAYARELLKGPMSDIAKLASDPGIWHAAMLVILFGEDDSVIEHDITQLVHECLNQELPVGVPLIESFGITDRAGNARCGIGLIPIRL